MPCGLGCACHSLLCTSVEGKWNWWEGLNSGQEVEGRLVCPYLGPGGVTSPQTPGEKRSETVGTYCQPVSKIGRLRPRAGKGHMQWQSRDRNSVPVVAQPCAPIPCPPPPTKHLLAPLWTKGGENFKSAEGAAWGMAHFLTGNWCFPVNCASRAQGPSSVSHFPQV